MLFRSFDFIVSSDTGTVFFDPGLLLDLGVLRSAPPSVPPQGWVIINSDSLRFNDHTNVGPGSPYMQNFAISFTIISILAGCLTSYFIAFNNGGPIAISWGWLVVGLMSTLVALAMAEIASAYPTAGGLYYWASKLGSPAWGWFTGWFNLVGQIAVTAAKIGRAHV